MEQQSWYVGDMSRSQIKWWGSNLSLRGPRGGFMIRIPDSKPNHLALMLKVSDTKVRNFLIKRCDGGFKLNAMWAQTMEDLIEQLSSTAQTVLPLPLLPGFFLKKDVAERKSKRGFGKKSQQARQHAQQQTSAASLSAAAASVGRKRNANDISPRTDNSHKKLRRRSIQYEPSQSQSHPCANDAAAPTPAAPTVATATAAALAAADDLAAAAAAAGDNVEAAESEEAAAIATMMARHNATLNGTLLSQSAGRFTAAGTDESAANETTMVGGGSGNDWCAADDIGGAASDEIMVEEDAEVLDPPHMHAAAHSYTAMHVDELSFAKGSTIAVIEKPEGGWWKGTVAGSTGWFPENHAAAAAPAPAPVSTASVADPLLLAPPVGLSGIKVRGSMTMLLPPPPGFDENTTGTATETGTDPTLHINGSVTTNSEN